MNKRKKHRHNMLWAANMPTGTAGVLFLSFGATMQPAQAFGQMPAVGKVLFCMLNLCVFMYKQEGDFTGIKYRVFTLDFHLRVKVILCRASAVIISPAGRIIKQIL